MREAKMLRSIIALLLLLPVAIGSPVVHFPFDEIVNQRTFDRAREDHGVVEGARTNRGVIGDALFFDGEGSMVKALELSVDEFTVSLWVKGAYAPKQGNAKVFAVGDIGLRWDGDRFKRASFIAGESTLPYGDLKPGIWYHLSATFDGSKVKWFRNGIILGEQEAEISKRSSLLIIGADSLMWGEDYFFAGAIDEFRIYDQALSDERVFGLFREYVHPADTDQDSCISIDEALAAISTGDRAYAREAAEWFAIGC